MAIAVKSNIDPAHEKVVLPRKSTDKCCFVAFTTAAGGGEPMQMNSERQPRMLSSQALAIFRRVVSYAFVAAAIQAGAQTTYNPTSGNATTGQTLFASCSGCHGASAQFSIPIRNAANAGWVINLAMANGMGGFTAASYNSTQEADLAAYISNLYSSTATNPSLQAVAHNSPGTGISLPNIYLGTSYGAFSSIQTTSAPSRGSVSYSGTTATYTPFTGQCGSDSFSWRAVGTIDTPPAGGGIDTYYSNTRTSSVNIANPSVPNISASPGVMSGTVGSVISTFSPTNTGGTPLSYSLTGTLPTGLSFSTVTGQISGTPTQAGTFNVTVNAFNCLNGALTGQSGSRAVTINIAKGSQSITFAALTDKLITDLPFVVPATATSGLAVSFGASGVCTSGGTNGSTISLTGVVGVCTVTASQAGDGNWFAASNVMRSFAVSDPSAEIFPPNCQAPAGWDLDPMYTGFQRWSVASDSASQGVCSFKSNPLPNLTGPQYALYAFTGDFQAGTISFDARVSSSAGHGCFLFAIDTAWQNIGGGCPALGLGALSGSAPFQAVNVPIGSGTHKIWILYYRDDNTNIAGSDAVWLDKFTMPLLTSITSSLTPSGQAQSAFSYQVVATNFPQTYVSTMLPPGLSLNSSTGQISGTPTQAGSYPVMVTASNPGGVAPSASDTKTITITIDKIPQMVAFAAINNRLTTAPAFTVGASAAGGSGNPVVFSTSGVCTASGTNGTTITLTGAVGTCVVYADQAGNSNYLAAPQVSQSFAVSTPGTEIFPANCVLPAGWGSGGATYTWSAVANDSSTQGACSLKTNAVPDSGTPLQADIVYSNTFAAGNVSFKYRVSSENTWDCFQFFIDATPQNVGGSCGSVGLVGNSGESGWVSVSFPITAGAHTLRWRYDKDDACCRGGQDAAWIEEVVFPQYTLSVAKAGAGTGTVFSDPSGIVCGGTCSATLSGAVSLTAVPNPGSYLSAWSGGGCSGNGACIVNLAGSTSVTATFLLITAPTAPQSVGSSPGNGQATITFAAPSSNGGAPITIYTSTCVDVAMVKPTATDSASSSPIVATGLFNGVQYSCTVKASNASGFTSPASTATLVTPRTVPDAPLIGMGTPGNGTATISFSAPGFNGGSNITSYTATCTAAGQTTRQASAATVTPITVSSMVNGVAYSCTVAAANVAGTGSASGAVSVTPRTAPGAPTMITSTPLDARVTLDWQPPASDGGSPVTGYNLSCNGGSLTVNGISPPTTVSGLTNGLTYTCTIAAVNAAGSTASSSFSFTPAVQAGSSYWSSICTNCHAMTPDQPQTNAAGTTPAVINYAIANQPLMSMNGSVTALTQAERTAIAGYLASVRPAASASTAFNTPVVVDLAPQLILGTVSFETMEIATPPASGNLTMLSGTQVTFTPAAGFVGMMTFSMRGARAMPSVLQGDPILVTVTVAPPPVPVVNSPASASGTNGVPFSYQITATNAPTGYNATGLPSGLSVNMGNGLISGTPTVGGGFMVTLTATNQGGPSLPATLNLTLNPASQTITFGAQTTASRPYVYNGTFTLAPAASASSGLAVTYVSKTPSVCSVGMGTTIIILAAGTCTIGANQGGNASFAVATEATQSVTITPSTPAAPVIGTASPGNNQAVVAFTPSADTGGVPIILYTATCTASGQTTRTGTNSTSPILVTGLTNLVQYSCSVTATNSAPVNPTSLPSASANVTPDQTPTPPSIVSANSATFTVNAPGSFSVVATGYPATFTYGQSGTLPTGVSFSVVSGVLSGTPTQAGSFPITFSVSNGSPPNASQNFTLTVNKGNQSISFANPGSVAVSAGPVSLSAAATSGLAVSFVSDTTGVCTIMGSNANLVGTGTCTIRAQQAGNGNFNPAMDVPQSFTVTQGTQSITFGAQVPASRAFGVMPFMLSPTASSSSMLAVTYTSLTTSVCTITGSTVTVGAAGTCTIAANQGGNASYAPAAQVTQSITITGTAPGAPTLNSATGGDQKITLAFTAPASNGGSPITGYTANCGGITASGASSPIAVTGLTNGMSYSCSVTASNGTAGAASNSLMATPNLLPGKTVWDANCNSGGCHLGTPNLFRLNVGGTNATALNYAVAHPGGLMPGLMITVVNSLSAQQKSDLVAYIADFIPPVTASTPVNTPVDISVASQVFLNTNTLAFTGLQQASAPANGALSFPGGTTITYTPAPGFTGTDTFTYRAFQAGVQTEPRTVSVTVTPAAPVITSSLTASATINQAFTYQIAASNGPTSYGASGLPGGLTVNMMTGVISGTPVASGNSMVTISANGPGGTGMATLSLTVNLASQTITFGAQSTPRTYSQGGTFNVSPLAMGGGSGNAVTYSSTTTGVCTVSGTTVTMVSAGICTIAANQLGNATYAAAPQVTQGVTIDGTAPAAPTGIGGVAGNMQATVNFTAPTNTGGLPITGYTVNCSGIVANGGASPITVFGLTNGTAYTCYVQATNLVGPSAQSSTVMITPVAIAFTGNVFSRKLHAGVAYNLPVADNPIANATIEPRGNSGGHQIVFVFTAPVSSATVTLTDAMGAPVGGGVTATPSYSGNELLVNIGNLPDASRVNVNATMVNGALSVTRPVAFLVGDVTQTGRVGAADIAAIKSRGSANLMTGLNFLFDISLNGSINAVDVSQAKARAGAAVAIAHDGKTPIPARFSGPLWPGSRASARVWRPVR